MREFWASTHLNMGCKASMGWVETKTGMREARHSTKVSPHGEWHGVEGAWGSTNMGRYTCGKLVDVVGHNHSWQVTL